MDWNPNSEAVGEKTWKIRKTIYTVRNGFLEKKRKICFLIKMVVLSGCSGWLFWLLRKFGRFSELKEHPPRVKDWNPNSEAVGE